MKSKQRKAPSTKTPEATTARRPWRWGIGAIVVASLVALVVVSTQQMSSTGTPLSAQPAGGGPDDGAQASSNSLRRFSLVDSDGQNVTRPAGGKPGVLVFTASNCTPCIDQAPSLVAEMHKFGSRAEILTVSIDPGDSNAAMNSAFGPVIGNPRGYPLAVDKSGQLAPAYGVQALGTEIVYDRAGREVWRGTLSPASEIGAALRKAGA